MSPKSQPAHTKTCDQCGRVGTRAFRVIPKVAVPEHLGKGTIGPFVICASLKACRSRWPRQPEPEW